MTDEDRELMCEMIEGAVKRTVNGKIDGIKQDIKNHNEKHEADMDELKPFIQAFSGVKVLGNAIKWLASLAVAYIALKSLFH